MKQNQAVPSYAQQVCFLKRLTWTKEENEKKGKKRKDRNEGRDRKERYKVAPAKTVEGSTGTKSKDRESRKKEREGVWRQGKQRQPREGEREGGSRAPPADKMIKRQISYIIFTLMLPYRNLWEGRDLCGRVYAPQGLIWERPTGRKSLCRAAREREPDESQRKHGERQHARTPAPDRKELCIKTLYVPDRLCQQPLSCVRNASRCDVRVYARCNARSGPRGNSMGRVPAASFSSTSHLLTSRVIDPRSRSIGSDTIVSPRSSTTSSNVRESVVNRDDRSVEFPSMTMKSEKTIEQHYNAMEFICVNLGRVISLFKNRLFHVYEISNKNYESVVLIHFDNCRVN